jgi:predicted nucleic acid-binding protein
VSERAFFDTNVLVYADDEDAGTKRDKARALIAKRVATAEAVVSTQVLQEYFVIATRKLGLAAESARRRVELLSQLHVVLVRPEVILSAIDLHRLHALSFWDALVVRCASLGGCAVLFTEDLNDGQIIDGVRVANPF